MGNIGIYCITNTETGKVYIGQSRNIERRWADHVRSLTQSKCHNRYLQRAWDTYKEQAFDFSILELCAESELDEKEIFWIQHFDSTNPSKGYNLESGGNFGKTVSDSVRLAKLGSNNPMYGHHMDDEERHKHAVSARGKGSKLTQSQVADIKKSLAEGQPQKEIAKAYGITPDAIHKIAIGKNWGYVAPELNNPIKQRINETVKARDELIMQLSAKGISRAQIARCADCTPSTVARILKSPSDYFKDSDAKMTLRMAVIDDFNAGLSKAEIMRKHNISSFVYVDITHEAFVKREAERHALAIKLRQSGMMVKDIATRLGVRRTTITKWTLDCIHADTERT